MTRWSSITDVFIAQGAATGKRRDRMTDVLVQVQGGEKSLVSNEQEALIRQKFSEALVTNAQSGLIPAKRNLLSKRILDLVICLPILLLTSPFYLLIMLAIYLDSPGPTIFRQIRVGKDGRPFTMYKFRSMYHTPSAQVDPTYQSIVENWMKGIPLNDLATPGHIQSQKEKDSSQLVKGNTGTKVVKALSFLSQSSQPLYKFKDDPRITRMGRFLRKTSLDELPQFLNVLRGEMSLVGPRPPILYEVEKYSERELARLTVMPGLTGLWQIKGRGRLNFKQSIDLDLEYVVQNSLWGDIIIILRTLPAVISVRGAA
jgi:lipopolysaccharide/colanic/teichoic acid biosynthesis glycosyltransferase